MIRSIQFIAVLCSLLMFTSCDKGEVIVIDGNAPYSTFNISDIKIENYVNRIFIDLLGREPLDDELEANVERLKAGSLKREIRDSIIYSLMTDTTYRENEISYKAAFIQNLYNLAKVRCIEGVSDDYIHLQISILANGALQDSLLGNWDGYYLRLSEIERNKATLDSRTRLFDGTIHYHQMFASMIDNFVYDEINMNTFNFVRASFDQLLWRLPTEEEFGNGFNMIEYNQAATLFGQTGSDKNEYIRILTESPEMMEGMLIYSFQIMLSRTPTASEVVTLLPPYMANRDIKFILAQIMVTDEYANFR